MARYQKGESGNPAGRPKGAKSRVNQKIRERINDLLDNNFDKIQNDLEQLEARDRVKYYIELLSFGLPKLRSIELENNVNDTREPKEIITTMTPEQLKEALKK